MLQNDGLLDLFLTGSNHDNKLYANLGGGVFSDTSSLLPAQHPDTELSYDMVAADLIHSGTEDVCAGGTPVAYALRFDAATDRFAEVTEVLNFGDTSHSGLSVVAADVDGTPWVGVLVFVLWVNCLCLRIGWVPRR